ncbi:uncharacterized protein LOC143036733 [Oratosquilla oratoria]|uniref:uncharacterized protein LOC143036733 n=1 Tax=Oratosquilla oratoria TaxID=337810 RepID=UPI003F75A39A
MTGQVLSGGEVSEPFNISNGVKQGCIYLGVYLRFRIEGSVFDLRRLNVKTKTTEKLILEALFVDDCALMAHKESDLQLIVDKFAEDARLFGLTISLGKTKVLLQPATASTSQPPYLSIEETQLKNAKELKYLGSSISSDGSLDKEISTRICKASQALAQLRTRVLNQRKVRLSTKLKVYRAVVLTSLFNGCESWTLYS